MPKRAFVLCLLAGLAACQSPLSPATGASEEAAFGQNATMEPKRADATTAPRSTSTTEAGDQLELGAYPCPAGTTLCSGGNVDIYPQPGQCYASGSGSKYICA